MRQVITPSGPEINFIDDEQENVSIVIKLL